MKKNFLKSLLVLSALMLAAVVAAGCGDSKSSSEQTPQQAMQSALKKTSTITSAKTDIKGSISMGSMPGSISLTGTGAFDTKAAKGGALELEFAIELAGTKQSFGIVSVDGKSYMVVGGKALEQKGDDSFDTGEVQEFIEELGDYLTNVKSLGGGKYSADVDVKKLISDNEDGKLSDLSIPGIGSGAKLQDALGNATVTVTVDSEGYAQTMDFNLSLTQAAGQSGSQGGLRATISLENINEPVTIEAPKNVVKDSSELGVIGQALTGN